jgi:hypothetical protein
VEKFEVVAVKFLESEHPLGNRQRENIQVGKAHNIGTEVLANASFTNGYRKIAKMTPDPLDDRFIHVRDGLPRDTVHRPYQDILGQLRFIMKSAAMYKTNIESLHVQVQRAAEADFRSAKNEDPVPYLRHTLAKRTHEPGANEGFPQEITHSLYEGIFGQIRGAKVIPDVDRFETAPVKAMSVKQMDPGAVSLVVA